MNYAEVAVNAAVYKTFHYHIPDHLDGLIEPGHLVRVGFRTAVQPGIVLSLLDETDISETKPIIERLHPEPLLTPLQMQISEWMSQRYVAPIGQCMWLWLPPGITGKRDVEVRLIQPDAIGEDEAEQKLITALKKQSTLRSDSLKSRLGKTWLRTVRSLTERGVIHQEATLAPPTVKPLVVDVASLAIKPEHIPHIQQSLGKSTHLSSLLERVIALADEQDLTVLDVMDIKGVGDSTLDKLIDTGALRIEDGMQVHISKNIDQILFEMRGGEIDLRVLNVLARSDVPVNVSWIYAQTGAKREDLIRLAERDLIELGEKKKIRDPLADIDYVPMSPPRMTDGQRAVWRVVREAMRGDGGGGIPADESARYKPDVALWKKLQPRSCELRTDMTDAERLLWERIRKKQLNGFQFRRQYIIDRFIVDFCCKEAQLVLEVDGSIHDLTQEEDALRTQVIESYGFRVLRFKNDDIFRHLDDVVKRIIEELAPLRRYRATSPGSVANAPYGGGLPSSPNPGKGDRGMGAIHLLHGVTGSGKTEIYLRAIEEAIAQGRQAILLVPEIALTPQTVRRVLARFPNQAVVVGNDDPPAETSVGLMHGRLTYGERYDTWHRMRLGEIKVVIGTRAALFASLPDVGLIILDEEHDSSYKHPLSYHAPYYHARDVAEQIIRLTGGVLLLGSATPSIESYFRAQRGDIGYLHLPDRIMGHRVRIAEQSARAGVMTRYTVEPSDESDALSIDLPDVEVVDMREELKAGNTDMFSAALKDALDDVLRNGQQAMLFLNRRGASTYVFCRDCGYVVECPRCDTPMTYHEYSNRLHCHHCDFVMNPPEICPECQSKRIKYFGAGTQQVEAALQQLFPLARSLRWDSDTAAKAGQHDLILQRFLNHQADVLIGTQMIAKGLDLPLVTLVGVVSADVGLNLPDFRSAERTFQLLTQVAGRAGRGLLGGKVILQTYQPENYAIQAASKHDYRTFYEQEIIERYELGYPPYRRLVRILFRHEQDSSAQMQAQQAEEILMARLDEMMMFETSLIGPVPCFFHRVNRMHRWQIILRGPNPARVFDGMDIPGHWQVDVDPEDVL